MIIPPIMIGKNIIGIESIIHDPIDIMPVLLSIGTQK
jgi:hypothetical protein